MNSQNYDHIEKEVLKREEKKTKTKNKTMKISGAGVKRLQKIIKNKKFIFFFFFFFSSFFFINPVWAEEQVKDLSVNININEDSSINIEENILYDFGGLKKHGIYRTIPYKYNYKGSSFDLRLSNIKVYDEDGQSYNFKINNEGKYKKIKIGDADKLVEGVKKYIIRYKVKRAITYLDDYDEFYWNVIGNKWEVPILQSKATVFFQKKIKAEDLKIECFSGLLGSQKTCNSSRYNYDGEFVKSVVFIDDKLNPGNSFTILLNFPKGFVDEPNKLISIIYFLKDNYVLLLPIFTFFFMLFLWFKKGKDPQGRKTIIAQFDAPDDLSPAEVGAIKDESVNQKDISAEIISLAVKGYLKIIRVDKKIMFFKNHDYLLLKKKDEDTLNKEHEKYLMKSLFKKSNLIKEKDFEKIQNSISISEGMSLDRLIRLSDLKGDFYKDLEHLKTKIYNSLVEKKYFLKNPNKIRGIYISIAFFFITLVFAFADHLQVLEISSLAITATIVAVFSFFMPKKTKKGVLAYEYILGLKKYMDVAEKDRIDFHNAPEKNPKTFEKLLPYAMVLGVEKKWSKQFEDIYKENPDWYNSGLASFSSTQLIKDLNGFSAKANSSLSSKPSSSGGVGGGGGFSGGGFGGGGGGSW